MEDSGENPFADPRASSSAFRSTGGYGTNGPTTNNNSGGNSLLQDYDPFTDTQQQFAGSATTTPAANPDPLEGYNPFEKNASSTPAKAAPAVLATEQPPPYSPSPAQQVDTDHYLQQQRELDRKARELEERERDLRAKDEELRRQEQQQQLPPGSVRNNWPPLPSWFPVKPCFYQDVEVEIPHAFQHYVKQMYYIWLFHVTLLVLNFIGGLALLFSVQIDATDFILSLLWLILFTPCSFICWFRPIYKAFRADSSLNFMIFFFVFFAQGCVSVLQAVGIWYSGMCGFINGIEYATKSNIAVGVICIIVGALFAFLAVVEFIMIGRIHRLYRSKDGVSIAQARKDAVSALMSNKEVRSTVVDVGVAAARSAATDR